MVRHRSRSLGLGLVALVGACFSPGETPLDPTFNGPVSTTGTPPETTETSADASTDPGTTTAVADSSDTSQDLTDTGPPSTDSTGPAGPVCGNGVMEEGEECDDANLDDDDACPSTCLPAACGDGFVQAGVEACDDANPLNDDACLDTCVAASCGDGFVQNMVEECDDANLLDNDECVGACAAADCGDGFTHDGVESCDDGNLVGGDGCGPGCLAECGNPGGGSLAAENGTGMGVMYCYEVGDSTEVRANKACDSHFGVGNCCLIPGGYSGLQYGLCGADGGAGTLHWHPDFHPDGHCDPFYVPGDVVAPGWCGVILGSFLD